MNQALMIMFERFVLPKLWCENLYAGIMSFTSYYKLLRKHQWKSVYAVVDEDLKSAFYAFDGPETIILLGKGQFRAICITYDSRRGNFDFSDALTWMYMESRVLLFFGHPPKFRKFLVRPGSSYVVLASALGGSACTVVATGISKCFYPYSSRPTKDDKR
ncbi:hypothetical protein RvY_18364 [Ramazzottius varieornatus]|uniref:Receptor ligand binding region domain-containing protein n=1 Tax=Ramazzottius varieornatus TaxID=947166 RepID=A0A1D1W5G4_RAMVA|nr:hypothetical protein RvY_18364 [Ramazzottius varieornatus]